MMIISPFWRGKGRCAGTLALVVLGLALNSRAATNTWLGNAGTNWNTAANWSGSSVPAPNDSLVFTNAGTAGASLNNDIPAGRVFSGITFAANATNAFTLSGNAFGLDGAIANSSTSIQTLNNAITLAANGTISPTATNLVLAGMISDGGGNFGLSLNGGKTVVLSGNNTFAGTLAVNSGVTLWIGAANNLGAGSNITFGGGSSSIFATASVVIPAGTTITIGGGSTASFGTLAAGTVFEVAAKLTGVGPVVKKSSSYSLGTVRFSNDANDYAGDFSMGYGNAEFTSVANQGAPSSLGKGAAGTGGQISLGNSTSSGTFRFVGAANSSSTRPLNWSASIGGLALDASGAGTVAFLANTGLRSGSGNLTLSLQGSNPGTNTLAQVINDGASSGTTTVTKSGAGAWVLAGTNTFSGGVNINGGSLQANAAETPGTSGPLGKGGTISFGGGALQYSPANTYDYSPRFSTAASQSYSVDLAGQTVTWAAPLNSSKGTLTVNNSAAGGKLTLAGTNTYTGDTTVLAGVLSVSSDSKLGAAATGDIVLDGGTLSAAMSFTLSSSRTVFLGPAGDGGGTLDVPGGATLTFGGAIADNGALPGSLTKSGGGTLTLSSSSWSTYTGDTTISAGTVAISGYGSIGPTGNLTIAPGATLDVSSATGGYTLGAGQTLVAGSGTSFVKGKLSLGSAALSLFWTNGLPSLTISGNKLVMNNNATTVTVAGTTQLTPGVYRIISKGSGGSVSGVVSNSLVNVAGAGALAGASLQITSGELYLNVHGSSPTTTTLISTATTLTYGDAVIFTAGVSPNSTGIVTLSDGTTTYGTAALAGGQATLTVAGGVLNAGAYPMTASYSGNSTYAPSVSGTITQTINQAVLTIAANHLSRWLGNANPTLTASYIGFVNGETMDVLSGAPGLSTAATPASPTGDYPVVITQGTLTNVTGNYALAFTNGTLTVTARAMPYPQGTTFPLMMYEVGDSPAAANVAAYGWNIVQTYGLTTNSGINSYLQLAGASSLGGDVPIPCGGGVSTNFVEWPQSQVQAWIQGSTTNNTIAWWDMPEEMRSWKPSEVQLLRDYRAWVRWYDTNGPRPTYEYTPNARTPSTQLGVVSNVDIIGASAYCEAVGQPHAWVRYKVQEAGVHAVALVGATLGGNYLAGQKTVVGVLYLADPGNGQLPTPQQSYHDVWSAIASGAQGIAVYAYWNGVNDNPVLTNNLNQFNLAASQISGSDIGQMVLYGTPNTNVAFTVISGPTNTDSFLPGDGYTWQYPSLTVLCKAWSNNVYVIAVNSTSNSVTANITNLPAAADPVTLPFELRSLPLTGNGFSDSFQPWQAHVYRLASPTIAKPVISSIVPAGPDVIMSCSGTPGTAYILQRSAALSNLAGWVNTASNTAPDSGLFSFTNTVYDTTVFYRLQRQ